MKKLGLLICSVLMLCACSSEKAKDLESLKIGVMPSYDSTPILWAKDKGIFDEMGINVEIIVYSNGNDRDTQIQTGAVDGIVSDIMGLVSLREANIKVQATSSTDTVFSVVSKPGVLDKKELSLAMAEVSVTQYAVDKGITDKTISKSYIDAIPQRLEMAAQSLIDGAILPEPMASMSKLKGLESTAIILDSPNVIIFDEETITHKYKSIQTFYQAYNKGIETLNNNPEECKDIVIEYLNLDPRIKDVMVLPQFNQSTHVKEETYNSVLKWMETTLNRKSSVPFKEAVLDINLD